MKALKAMFDPLWPATILGAFAIAVAVVCFAYLTIENAGSKTFSLAAAALLSAILVFGIQALFELRPVTSKRFITAEYTIDRSPFQIRQWVYASASGMRITVETMASKDYEIAHPTLFDFADDLSNASRVMTDFALFSFLAYLSIEQFDWQLQQTKYSGRTGTTTLTAAGSKPEECSPSEIRHSLLQAGNAFASSKPAVLFDRICLPPNSTITVSASSVIITTRLVTIEFLFKPSGSNIFADPNNQSAAPALSDGRSRFLTSYVGITVTTTYSGIRSQNRQMEKYKNWASNLVEGAQLWFEAK